MVILTIIVPPRFEDHRGKLSPAPADCAELLRIIIFLIDQIRLVENLLRLAQADTMLLLDRFALPRIEVEAHRCI